MDKTIFPDYTEFFFFFFLNFSRILEVRAIADSFLAKLSPRTGLPQRICLVAIQIVKVKLILPPLTFGIKFDHPICEVKTFDLISI